MLYLSVNNVILTIWYSSFFNFIPEFIIYTIAQNLEIAHSFLIISTTELVLYQPKVPEGDISNQRTIDVHGLD